MISILVDPASAIGHLGALSDQVPFAVARGLNLTANDAQAAERYVVKRDFHLKREAFILRQIYISKQDRANKTTWRVVIQVAPQFADLPGFEEGDDRAPRKTKWLWKPNPEVFKTKIIGKSNPLAVKNLHFHKDPSGRMLGDQRTFMVRTKKKGQVLVLQRVDKRLSKRSSKLSTFTLDNVAVGMGPKGKKEKALTRTAGVRMLYQLVARSHVPAKLHFVETVTKTAQDVFPARMREALDAAIESAR